MQMLGDTAKAAVNLSYYRVTGPAAIHALMERLERDRVVMTLFSEPPASDAAADTQPCGMAVFSRTTEGQPLVLDVSNVPSPPQGADHAMPARVQVVAYWDGGVRMQWELQAQWQPIPHSLQAGRWELQSPWPQEVLQYQRRRHPRVQLPLGQSFHASFLFGQRRCVLTLDDVSRGGVGLRGTRSETAMLFLGRKLQKVQLDLGGDRLVEVDVTVRSRRRYRSFLLGEQVLVGCSLDKVPPEAQAAIEQLEATQYAPAA